MPDPMDSPHSSRLSLSSLDTTLVPTTDRIAEHFPRFRILIVGRSGVGKSSLINAIFKASLADVRHDGANAPNINEGITSEHNKLMIIHDSEGYRPGDQERFSVLEKFIRERSQMEPIAERLHAIWLCITVPHAGGTMFQPWDEKIFHLNQRKVPIIVVYTKFDLILPTASKGEVSSIKDGHCQESAECYFKERYGHLFETSTKNIDAHIPYTAVATSLPATLQRLVDVTLENLHVEISSPTGAFRPCTYTLNQPAGQDEDLADAAEIALAMAQRIDMSAKIAASIKVGGKKYWRAIAFGFHYLNVSIEKCLITIHKDIVTIWNIWDLDKSLHSDEFRRRMKVIVEDLSRPDQMNTGQGKIPIAVAAGAWTEGVYRGSPEHVRCLMGYVVDLTLVLEAVFQVSLEECLGREALQERLNDIICEFYLSERKKAIHTAIWAFVGAQRPSAEAMVNKIESLIRGNQTTIKDMQFDQKRTALPSLITIIRYELSAKGRIVNKITLHLMRKLLDSPDYGTIGSELKSTSDVELLLDFILHLLRNGSLWDSGIRDANQMARRLMCNLISKKNVMPGSLFITDIKTSVDVGTIAMGGFGFVFEGDYKGRQVMLKALSRGHKTVPSKTTGRDALAWQSLTKHRFILPLLGVFEDKLQLFLVLPFIVNGTLSEWRKRNQPPLVDIHSRMFEVTEGIRYIHSEGIVHGDLRGENILLDANFHCQIADIGLTQNSDAIITLSASPFLFNYAAPELFVVRPESDVLYEDHDSQKEIKTVKTDIYAFGYLYYTIFFNTVPFQGKDEYQITRLIKSGELPPRLESPRIENGTWNIIQTCWRTNPLSRPTIEEIRALLTGLGFSFPATLRSLIVALNESMALRGSVIGKVTVDLAYELFNLPEHDITASELRTTSDAELLLEFLLDLLRNNSLANSGIQGANQKARRLLFKLITMTNVIPRSLFITDVRTDIHYREMAAGGFGSVFKGEYAGQLVALKVLYKIHHQGSSLRNDFCMEALAWRSISHRFILPLLGIYEDKSSLFLVSPFMTNGTLARWRRDKRPDAVEIHRVMLEVAEAIQYLHSEGMVHGDLHSRNILLDSEFHCQITDFGLTRHSEATVAWTTNTFVVNYAAPELFGMCSACGQKGCDGCCPGHTRHTGKTMNTDVYAFGCLYYEAFFDAVPFKEKTSFQIMRSITSGIRPRRLESPKIEDNTWDLIQNCWISKPSERPTMDEIVKTMTLL